LDRTRGDAKIVLFIRVNKLFAIQSPSLYIYRLDISLNYCQICSVHQLAIYD
jgi:hypothetical protein